MPLAGPPLFMYQRGGAAEGALQYYTLSPLHAATLILHHSSSMIPIVLLESTPDGP